MKKQIIVLEQKNCCDACYELRPKGEKMVKLMDTTLGINLLWDLECAERIREIL